MTETTIFNKDLDKQWIPFWNGMIHLVGEVQDGVITRRHDWEQIMVECQQFEHDFLTNNSYCESLPIGSISSYLEDRTMAVGLGSDCKFIAQDFDLLYFYCQRKKFRLWTMVVVFLVMLILVVGVVVLVWKNNVK